jgi:hypothetical protein
MSARVIFAWSGAMPVGSKAPMPPGLAEMVSGRSVLDRLTDVDRLGQAAQ